MLSTLVELFTIQTVSHKIKMNKDKWEEKVWDICNFMVAGFLGVIAVMLFLYAILDSLGIKSCLIEAFIKPIFM